VRYATRGRFILAADMSFAIRAAGEHDVAGMAALRAQTWGTEPYWAARIGGYLNGEHSPQQALAERVAFVALDGDVVVGLVAGHGTKRFGCDGELEWMAGNRRRADDCDHEMVCAAGSAAGMRERRAREYSGLPPLCEIWRGATPSTLDDLEGRQPADTSERNRQILLSLRFMVG
jgi:hypothetical protein